MAGPSITERSTIISRYLDERAWRIYTEDANLIRRLESWGFVAVETLPHAKKFDVPLDALLLRKGKRKTTREYTEEERQAVRERLAKARHNRA